MQRIINIAAAQRIIVNVLALLPQNFIGLHYLRVTALLPKLMFLVRFVPQFVVCQLLQ